MDIPITLLESIVPQITENHVLRIRRIDEEDYAGVIQKTEEALLEKDIVPTVEYLKGGVFALKQYYAVAMLDPVNAHAVSLPVDLFWHSHILHTKQYMDFCNRIVGEYMHHVPLNHQNVLQVENVRTLYDYTLDILPKLFNFIDERFWPTGVADAVLICWHKGNIASYPELQSIRLFDPDPRGQNYAFSV